MKTFFTSLLLLSTFMGWAQHTESYEALLKKSRRATTTSIILVSTGPVIAAGGIGTLIYGLIKKEDAFSDYYYDVNGNYVEAPSKKYTTEIAVGAAATLVGMGLALSSIAFTNKADDYRREARKLKLKTSTGRIDIPGFKSAYANTRITQYKLSLVVPIGR